MSIGSVTPVGKGFQVKNCAKQSNEGENVESLISTLEDKSRSLDDRREAINELTDLAQTNIPLNLVTKIVNALIRGLRDEEIRGDSLYRLCNLISLDTIPLDLKLRMVDPLLRVLRDEESWEGAAEALGDIAGLEDIPDDVADKIVSSLLTKMYRSVEYEYEDFPICDANFDCHDVRGREPNIDQVTIIAEILVRLPESVRMRFSVPQVIVLWRPIQAWLDPAARPNTPNTYAYDLTLLVLRMPEDVDFTQLYIEDADGERYEQNCLNENDPNCYGEFRGERVFICGIGGSNGAVNCEVGLGLNGFRIFLNTNNSRARAYLSFYRKDEEGRIIPLGRSAPFYINNPDAE